MTIHRNRDIAYSLLVGVLLCSDLFYFILKRKKSSFTGDVLVHFTHHAGHHLYAGRHLDSDCMQVVTDMQNHCV